MVKLNKKEFERIKTTSITEVNYRIDELDKGYFDVAYAESVKSYPYSEEKRIEIIEELEKQDRDAQDVAFALATLKLQVINYRLFQIFAMVGTGVSLLQNMPVTGEYGTMCALGGTVAVMVPAVLESLTERKIKKINGLSLPGVRRI